MNSNFYSICIVAFFIQALDATLVYFYSLVMFSVCYIFVSLQSGIDTSKQTFNISVFLLFWLIYICASFLQALVFKISPTKDYMIWLRCEDILQCCTISYVRT